MSAVGPRSQRIAVAIVSLLVMALPVPRARSAEASSGGNSCESCHRDPDFLVTNKKLYDYYQQWQDSVHHQEEVTCDDCHGGNAQVAGKEEAHGDGVAASDPASDAVWETAAAAPSSLRPAFMKMTGFLLASANARLCISAGPSLTPSA